MKFVIFVQHAKSAFYSEYIGHQLPGTLGVVKTSLMFKLTNYLTFHFIKYIPSALQKQCFFLQCIQIMLKTTIWNQNLKRLKHKRRGYAASSNVECNVIVMNTNEIPYQSPKSWNTFEFSAKEFPIFKH
jgi:hypothetical protein